MMALDMYWMSNDDWHEIIKKDNGKYDDVIKEDAPPEAKASYEHYMEQIRYAAKFEAETGRHVI